MRYLIAIMLINLITSNANAIENLGDYNQQQQSQFYNCNATSLNTTPSGQTTTYTTNFGVDKAEITVWRMPCQDGGNLPVMTIRPITYRPFVCTFNFKILQGNREFDNILLIEDPNDKWTFICEDIKQITTVAIDQLEGPYFNSDQAFTLVHKQPEYPAIIIDIPEINASVDLEIKGELSGSYYQPNRNGEGFVIQVTGNSNNKAITVYWFTYFEGNPLWLIGSASLSSGQSEANVELLELNGTGFGQDFDPDEINMNSWGSLNMRWTECHQMIIDYNSTVGLGSGSYDLQRITDGIQGHECH